MLRRVDTEQAAIASLMSSLIGINFPLNSVGKIPLEYIGMSLEWKADTTLANARQIFGLTLRHHGNFIIFVSIKWYRAQCFLRSTFSLFRHKE